MSAARTPFHAMTAPVCIVCAKPISVERTIIARSRGSDPKYCSGDCRTRAARKRYTDAMRAKKKEGTLT